MDIQLHTQIDIVIGQVKESKQDAESKSGNAKSSLEYKKILILKTKLESKHIFKTRQRIVITFSVT